MKYFNRVFPELSTLLEGLESFEPQNRSIAIALLAEESGLPKVQLWHLRKIYLNQGVAV